MSSSRSPFWSAAECSFNAGLEDASRITGLSVLGAGCLLLLTAVTASSPWLGTAAAIISCGGLMLIYGGWMALRELGTTWILLWMAIPLPGALHDQLIRLLQAVTAVSASSVLELAGLPHVLKGFVFALPDRELFVAEACSGIHSQFVLVAAAALLVVICRRHWLHALLLLSAAGLLSAIINTGRVITVVTAAVWFDRDLSTGWAHQMIGYIVVLFGFGLLLSTDRFLLGLLAPVMSENKLRRTRASGWLPRLWNTVMAPPETADEVTQTEPPAPVRARDNSSGRIPRLMMSAFLGLFLIAGIVQLLTLGLTAGTSPMSRELNVTVRRDWLPESLEEWECVAYESHVRDRHSDNGEYGHSWRYRTGQINAAVAVDFPFLGWHELTDCYTSTGWKESKRWVDSAPVAGGEDSEFVVVQLTKPTGEQALLMFSLFDGLLQPVSPLTSPWKTVRLKLARSPVWSLFRSNAAPVSESLVTFQIQLFVPTHPFNDAGRQNMLRNAFIEFRNRLHDQWSRQSPAATAPDS